MIKELSGTSLESYGTAMYFQVQCLPRLIKIGGYRSSSGDKSISSMDTDLTSKLTQCQINHKTNFKQVNSLYEDHEKIYICRSRQDKSDQKVNEESS